MALVWHNILDQFLWWLGLVASIVTAVAGMSHIFPHPWNHVLAVGGLIGSVVNAYVIKPHFGGHHAPKETLNENPSEHL